MPMKLAVFFACKISHLLNGKKIVKRFVIFFYCSHSLHFCRIFFFLFFLVLKTCTEIQFTGTKSFSVTHRVSAYINSKMVQIHSLKVTHKKNGQSKKKKNSDEDEKELKTYIDALTRLAANEFWTQLSSNTYIRILDSHKSSNDNGISNSSSRTSSYALYVYPYMGNVLVWVWRHKNGF